MAVDKAQFRTDFPEFADTDTFPDSSVNFYLNVAGLMLNAPRWANLLDLGTELFVAHNIVLEALQQQTVDAGGLPGISKGVVSAESPGDVSVSYDTSGTLEIGAGHWNYTVYGQRFKRMLNMAGAGPIHIGGGCGSTGGTPGLPGGAWGGPPSGFGFGF